MSKRSQKQSDGQKANFFQSISFQNILIYVLILLAFIVYAIVQNVSMSDIVITAINASASESELQAQISELQRDYLLMGADLNTTSGMAAVGQAMNEGQFDDYDAAKEDIETRMSYISSSILATQTSNGTELVAQLETDVNNYLEQADAVRALCESGDGIGAIVLLQTDYNDAKTAMESDLDEVDVAIEELSDNLGTYLESVKASTAKKGYLVLGVVIVIVIVSFLLSFFRINRVVLSISYELQEIINNINKGQGDLTARINTKTKTELAMISDCINQFISTLQVVIKDVKSGAMVLTSSSDNMVLRIQSASDNVTNTSAAMEELAASMENVSTTAIDLNDKVFEVREATNAIDAEAKEGASKANEIKMAADEIKKEATEKKDNTGAKMEELSRVLEVSVKESEQVNQIGDLTNEILDIASQTNLLALNASIEAARAGEAGKGFAVVADEISKLAANSRDTAGNIQEISAKVTAAVKTLSDNAVQVIEFINENVLADYDAFVETGSKFEDTATMIDEMLATFSDKADNLNNVMNEMADRIETISNSVNESSNAIGMSAQAATEIVGEIQGINEAMDQNNDVTKQLNSSTQKFEIV